MAATARPASLNGLQATALQVVRQHFGDHTETICAALIRYPKRTLKELQGDTDIAVGQLRNCLLILLQHNLVTATIANFSTHGHKAAGQVLYSFSQEAAVLRLRFPKFMAHINKVQGGEKDGVLAERILEAVLENGRASWNMIWEQIKDVCEEGVTEERAQKVGDTLIKSKYIVRVIPVSERVEPALSEYSAPKRSTAAGKRKAQQEAEERESKARKIDLGCVMVGNDEKDGMVESIANHGALWHVNPPAFMWDLRAIAIERVMTDRFGAATASLMKLLLRTVRSKALQVCTTQYIRIRPNTYQQHRLMQYLLIFLLVCVCVCLCVCVKITAQSCKFKHHTSSVN